MTDKEALKILGSEGRTLCYFTIPPEPDCDCSPCRYRKTKAEALAHIEGRLAELPAPPDAADGGSAMSREVIIIHAIRTYHAKNQGLLFDLSMVKTDDYWAAMDFLGKYSFLIEKVQLEALPRETEEPK